MIFLSLLASVSVPPPPLPPPSRLRWVHGMQWQRRPGWSHAEIQGQRDTLVHARLLHGASRKPPLPELSRTTFWHGRLRSACARLCGVINACSALRSMHSRCPQHSQHHHHRWGQRQRKCHWDDGGAGSQSWDGAVYCSASQVVNQDNQFRRCASLQSLLLPLKYPDPFISTTFCNPIIVVIINNHHHHDHFWLPISIVVWLRWCAQRSACGCKTAIMFSIGTEWEYSVCWVFFYQMFSVSHTFQLYTMLISGDDRHLALHSSGFLRCFMEICFWLWDRHSTS